MALSPSELDPDALRAKLRDIAHMEGATDKARTGRQMPSIAQRAFVEARGTAFLLAAVVPKRAACAMLSA